jgi:hypothetical protein
MTSATAPGNWLDGGDMTGTDLRERLVELERGFWEADADFYDRNLASDAVMVLPDPAGVMDRDAVVEAIGSAARWVELRMDDIRMIRLGTDAAALTYRAAARRTGGGPLYSALVSSTYVRHGDTWRLALHQQSPTDPADGTS